MQNTVNLLSNLIDEEYARTNYKHIQLTHKDIARHLGIDEKKAISAAIQLEVQGKIVLHYEANGGFNHLSII